MQKDKNELKNGIETCWHPSGKKSTEGLWVDGSKQGNGLSGIRMVNSKVRSHLKIIFGMETISTGMKMVKK